MFNILTIIILMFIGLILYKKIYQNSIILIFWFIATTFYTPAFYYEILRQTSYKNFSSADFDMYLMISILIVCSTILLILIFERQKIICFFHSKLTVERKINFFLYAGILLGICLIYFFLFYDRFPLIQTLFFGATDDLERPDTSGSIPAYFTFQTIFYMVMPSLYFYLKQYYHLSKIQNLAWMVLLSFLLIVGGNKGILVYFYLFIWIYEWKGKINIKLILMGVSSLWLYGIILHGVNYNIFQDYTRLYSPLRRFFVTQGAMFINRIAMLNKGYTFTEGKETIQVFEYVYGYVGGSSPTFFLGDLIIRYGYLIGFVICIFLLFLLYLVSKRVDRHKNLYEIWSFYLVLYLLGNAGISINFFLRLLAICINIFVFHVCMNQRKQHIDKIPSSIRNVV